MFFQNQSKYHFLVKKRFFEALWQLEPGWATALGNLKYKDEFKLPGEASRKEALAFADRKLSRIESLDTVATVLVKK